MDLAWSADEERFRDEIRAFFADEYPRHVIAKLSDGIRISKEDQVASQRALQRRGWLGIGWPQEYGGTGWTAKQRYIFEEELELAGAPNLIPMAIIYIGPIICAFGTAEQRARWLPDILESRALWAQGYSEPEAGSDLASLTFSAVRHDDEYVLNGTKIWTSGAHWADWIFCLCRTSRTERKQDGISLICIDLASPGITIRPIISIDGGHELNEVVFENVRVPATNRIGEEGKAWHYANVLLKNERLSYAHIGRKKADLAAIRHRAMQEPAGGGRTMMEEPAFASSLIRLEIEVDVLEIALLRALSSETSLASVASLKILTTECAQRITELAMRLSGRGRLPMLDRSAAGWEAAAPLVDPFGMVAVQHYLFERSQTIYGGATEVQKLIAWRDLSHRLA